MPTTPDGPTPHRVLVAGGGVAGLEAVLALRELAGERLAITLLTPERHFTYRPMAVAVPFARGHVLRHDLVDFARHTGVELVRGELAEVDAPARAVVTTDGRRVAYDSLVIAVGAGSEPAFAHVRTWTPELDQEVFGGLLADLEEGYAKRVAFVVPPDVAWPLPAYELALMTAWDARDMGQNDVEITVFTPEERPLGLFGREASEALARDLREAGIAVRTGAHVREDADAPARLVVDGAALEAQRVIALPRATGCGVGGLPVDDRGFILTDAHGRVQGLDGVWAAGDAIAFPIKQGGLAAQQADAAAEAIAAALGAEVDPQPFHPVLRGVLLTGRGRQWIRRDIGTDDAEGEAQRHALWWPPTKVAGRFLAPYLASVEEAPFTEADRPAGQLVEFSPAGHGA